MSWLILESRSNSSSYYDGVYNFFFKGKWVTNSGTPDKIAKFVMAYGAAAGNWGSGNIAITGNKIAKAGGEFRLVYGLMNIPVSIQKLPEFITSFHQGKQLASALWNGSNQTVILPPKDPTRPNFMENVHGRKEQGLALTALIFNSFERLTFILGLGGSRTIACFEKHIGSVSPLKHAFGELFPVFMLVNHASAVISSTANVFRGGLAYERQSTSSQAIQPNQLWSQYDRVIDDNVTLFTDKYFDLALDGCKFGFGPPELKLILACAVATIGLWRTLRKD